MPSRAELVARAAVVGLDASTIPNDSKLEQKLLYLEKNATAITGTIATTTLTSDATTVANNDTVTLGNVVYTFKTALSEAKAGATLTSSGVFSDGETVTVDGWVYTFRTALSTNAQVTNEVLIGANQTASHSNLKDAVNGVGGGSTTNAATYAHPTVTATSATGTTTVLAAKNVGTYGNAFASLKTCANASFAGSFFTGGAAAVANQVLIGVNAAANLSNLKAALNDTGTSGTNYSSNTSAHKEVTGSTITSTTLVINARNFSVGNASVATTTTATHLSFTGATLASGVAKIIAAASSNDLISGAVDHI